MISSNEWVRNPEFDIGTRSGILRSEFIRIIEQIQLDARKQGMTDAVKLIADGHFNSESAPDYIWAIPVIKLISVNRDNLK